MGHFITVCFLALCIIALAEANDKSKKHVTVSEASLNIYQEIQHGLKDRYVIYYIKDEKHIEPEVLGARNKDYADFLSHLQAGGECRYGIYDYECWSHCKDTSTPKKKLKLVLIFWCPESANRHQKELYSSSFETLRHSLKGLSKQIVATHVSEISQSEVEEKIRHQDHH